jgi:hypothetical protein
LRPIGRAMRKETKIRLAWWIGFPLAMVVLRFGDGGRIWNYMEDHLWLTCALPIVVLLLVVVVRGFSMQHRRGRGEDSNVGGAQSAKP